MEEYLVIIVELKVLSVILLRGKLLQEICGEHQLHLDLCEEEVDAWET